MTGSAGDANGSLSIITQLNWSPTTSTPCQKLEVASNTECGVSRNCLRSWERGAVALHEQRVVERHLGNGLHLAKHRVAGKQNKGPPFRSSQYFDDFAPGSHCEFRGAWVGHARRKVKQRLTAEVELGRKTNFIGPTDAEPLADVVESAVDGQSRRTSAQSCACDREEPPGRSSGRHR